MPNSTNQKITGYLDIIAGLLILAEAIILYSVPELISIPRDPSVVKFMVLPTAIVMAIIGTLVIKGGIYTMQGTNWTFSYVTSIFASLFIPILAWPAILLLTFSKKEWPRKIRIAYITVLTVLIALAVPFLYMCLLILFLGGM